MDSFESKPRSAFTPGWSNSIHEVEGLPVKRNGVVIPVKRKVQQKASSDLDEEQIIIDEDDPVPQENEAPQVHTPKKKLEIQQVEMVHSLKSLSDLEKLKRRIGEICSAIIAKPELSLKKKVSTEDDQDNEIKYRMVDMFALMESNDFQTVEMAILSTLLVFKDICPGYRIRPGDEYDKEVKLKKDTKALKDFELSLLGAYQKYLKILKNKVEIGLQKSNQEVEHWNSHQKLGLSALRCQCELLRSLSHFNFRSQLIESVTFHSLSADSHVSQVCCNTMTILFKNDSQYDLSFEIVRSLASNMMARKYNVNPAALGCLAALHLTVHADDSKSVHRQAKNERKKRKNASDDVEVGVLEASTGGDKVNKKRFQADCLHEISLIYFRIIKQKIGFTLLPVALDGLSKITHLINIDTVQDLMEVLRSLLVQQPPLPLDLQLQCIHCALCTLAGPGKELNLDSDPYLYRLCGAMQQLPAVFSRWDVVLDCVELYLVKRREERTIVVQSFVKALVANAILRSQNSELSATLYAFTHALLVRYPSVRQNVAAMRLATLAAVNGKKGGSVPSSTLLPSPKATKLFEEDEFGGDLAMQSLRDAGSVRAEATVMTLEEVDWAAEASRDKIGDATWAFPLQRLSTEARFEEYMRIISATDVNIWPYRTSEAKLATAETICSRLERSFVNIQASLNSQDKIKNNAKKGKREGNKTVSPNGGGNKRRKK